MDVSFHLTVMVLHDMLQTSRALVDAGGLWSSRENIPVLNARLWSSSRSLRTVRRKAAFESVFVATCV